MASQDGLHSGERCLQKSQASPGAMTMNGNQIAPVSLKPKTKQAPKGACWQGIRI
jgi:hypothetical protein